MGGVPRCGAVFPFLNKLRQLETPALRDGNHIGLCDTDLAFASSIDDWIVGDRPRNKIVDIANPPRAIWQPLFTAAGFGRSPRPAKTFLDAREKLPCRLTAAR